MGKKRIDLTGQRFCRLVVINYNEEVSRQKKCSYWNCICDCGNEMPPETSVDRLAAVAAKRPM